MPGSQKISNWINQNYNFIVVFFTVFYAVGFLGMSLNVSRRFFIQLVPFALLLSTFAVVLAHQDYNRKTYFVFTLIYLLGFSAEIIGVQTGAIFGSYHYGKALGTKLMDTPLIIGLNWLLLVYLAISITNRLKLHSIIQIIAAASILVIYDIIIEQAAPALDMWHWEGESVPIQNFIAWFVLGLMLSGVLRYSNVKLDNRLASLILICQLTFFSALIVLFK